MENQNEESLLVLLQRKLLITWNSTGTDEELLRIIQDAIPAMRDKIGDSEIDFSQPGRERNLFLEYCKYQWNDYGHMFDLENRGEIIALRIKHGNT